MNNENNKEIITSITKSELISLIEECIDKRLNSTNILNEGKRIASGKGMYIGIFVTASHPDMLKDPYFKVFDNISFNSAKYVTRIKMLSPDYVENHRNSHGLQNRKLNSKEIDTMITMLKNPTTIDGKYYKTGWKGLCAIASNLSYQFNINSGIDFKHLEMPDYNILKNK